MHCIQQLQEYLKVAHSQHSDFDYETGKKQLEQTKKIAHPCATRQGAVPGDPVWCLCEGNGRKVRWKPGDGIAQKKYEFVNSLHGDAIKNMKPGGAIGKKKKTMEVTTTACNLLLSPQTINQICQINPLPRVHPQSRVNPQLRIHQPTPTASHLM